MTEIEHHTQVRARRGAQGHGQGHPRAPRGRPVSTYSSTGVEELPKHTTRTQVALAEQLAAEQNKVMGLAQVEIDFTAE